MSNFNLRYFFLPLFRFSSFPGLSVFTAFAFFFFKKKYMAKPSFKRMFLGDYFIDYILTR